MNYLAHIFLSGTSPKAQVGGFIADAVKGKYDKYPFAMQLGIWLHRKVDEFTDNHVLVKDILTDLRPRFGRYSVILPDLFFDHFLAKNFSNYSKVSLRIYAYRFYSYLLLNYYYLPSRVQGFLWHFIFTNRLCRYCTVEGLFESLQIMVTYRNIPLSTKSIEEYFVDNYTNYQSLFNIFFSDLQSYLRQIRKNDSL